MSLNYLEWIGAGELDSFIKPGATVKEVLPRFTTLNAAYQKELERMKEAFRTYVRDDTLTRPFLYLILGPPVAGKSYLIEQLIEELKKDASGNGEGKSGRKSRPVAFQAVNLSEMRGPEELHRVYLRIIQNTANGFFTVTLLDEFDVRWAEGSAIKYLINPVYDGKYWNGYEFQKFGKCAFFFAGSYLQDHETLMKTHRTLTGVNLSKFLNDLYLASRKREDAEALREIAEVQEYCYIHQKWRAEVDPRTDAIYYLRNLDKIRDFLSRIAGNVIEILDVSQPLGVTQDEFAIEYQGLTPGEAAIRSNKGWRPTAKLRIEDVVSYIEEREQRERRYWNLEQPEQAWVEYKNALLCERLLRVIDFINKRFNKHLRQGKEATRVLVERKLLNYLTLTPLINGMRSLEQLVNMLDSPAADIIDMPAASGPVFERAKIRMVIHNAEKFSDPSRVWDMLAKSNPTIQQIMQVNDTVQNSYVSVPLH